MQKNNYIIVGLVWVFVTSFLFYQDARGGERVYIKDFSKNQYEMSYIFPLGRTEVYSDKQIILGEPVYFTAYTPQTYGNAQVTFEYEGDAEGWRVGYQIGEGFQYDLVPFADTVHFDIDYAYIEKDNTLRFILAHPEGEVTPLTITSFEVTFNKPLASYLFAWKKALKNKIPLL